MSRKPLGGPAYGSIPHLPGSRVGPSDHHIHEGQARIATARGRDKNDLVIVQEKLDGSCVSVARIDGYIVALTRAGYPAHTSPYLQHHYFGYWVRRQAAIGRFDPLKDGERVCGEWLAQAHGTRYDLPHEPFVAFDLFSGDRRCPYGGFVAAALAMTLATPRLIHTGDPMPVDEILTRLDRPPSYHGALDPIEGFVVRVERRGEADFLCKYVRPGKVDGAYLPSVTGKPAVWNWRPEETH